MSDDFALNFTVSPVLERAGRDQRQHHQQPRKPGNAKTEQEPDQQPAEDSRDTSGAETSPHHIDLRI